MLKDGTLTYISLFSSAGVGCYGFKQEGYQCIATCELLEKRLNIQKYNNKCLLDSGYILGDLAKEEIKEMKRLLDGISFKTLSATLKELEADNLVHRKEYPQIPPKVEYSLTERGKSLMPSKPSPTGLKKYSLTERGKSLMPILDQLCEWGDKNRK